MLIRSFAIVPAVDVLDGRAVRLTQGDYERVDTAGDPFELVRRAAAASPPFVHVVALAAARDGGVSPGLAEAVAGAASTESSSAERGSRARSRSDHSPSAARTASATTPIGRPDTWLALRNRANATSSLIPSFFIRRPFARSIAFRAASASASVSTSLRN